MSKAKTRRQQAARAAFVATIVAAASESPVRDRATETAVVELPPAPAVDVPASPMSSDSQGSSATVNGKAQR